ncbi:MAG: PTS sugar transporter [Desulfuromonas sp.]|nr:MAG: PTS sugar transporter [Desulfuromonas sp.]
MAGLLIVTHANFAGELLRAAEMIVGPISCAETVSISREDSVEQIVQTLGDACATVARDQGGVIVMTDMFGGTPTNLSLTLVDHYEIEIVTGVNLPMVLKFVHCREMPLKELALALRDYAADKISVVSEMLESQGRGG